MAVARVDIEVNSKGDVVLKKVEGGLQGIEKQAGKTSAALSSVFAGIGLGAGEEIFGVLKDIPGALLEAATAAMRWADSVTTSSQKTAIGVESIQALKFSAAEMRVEWGAMEKGIGKMEVAIGKSSPAFKRLGLDLTALKAMKPEDQFAAVADAMSKIKDPAAFAAAGMAIFGKAWQGLAPILREGGDRIRETAEEAKRLGLVMSKDDIAGGRQMAVSLGKLHEVWEGLIRNFGTAITSSEPLKRLFEGLTEILGEFSKTVQENGAGLRSFVDVGVVFVVEALANLVTVVSVVVNAWSGLLIAAETIKGGFESVGVVAIQFWEAVKDAASGNLSAAKADLAAIGPAIDDIRNRVGKNVADLMRENEEHQKTADKVIAKFNELAQHVEAGVGVTRKATAANKDFGGSFDDVVKGAEKAAKEAEKMREFWFQFYVDNAKEHNKWMTEQERIASANSKHQLEDLQKQLEGLKTLQDAEKELHEREAADAEKKRQAQLQVASDLAGMAETVRGLAGEFDGATGAALSFGAAGLAVFSALKQHANQTMTTTQKLALALSTAASIVSAGRHDLSGGHAAMSGAAQGAAAGAAIGGPWGAVIGGIGGALLGFFSGSRYRAIARTAGATLGVELGQAAVDRIQATMKDLHVGAAAAALLNLGSAITDSGRSASSFAPQFAQLMAGIAKGTIPAKEGLAQLDSVFSQMRTEMAGAGAAGFNFLDSMVDMARVTGTMTQAMRDFVKETGKASGAGFKALFDNVLHQVDATVGALSGRVNRLKEQLGAPGTSGDDKDRIKDHIHQLEGEADAAAAHAGERLNDLGILAVAAVQRMREAGASSAEIFEALGPAIDSAIEAAQRAGVELTGPFAQLASERTFATLNADLVSAAEGLEYVARAAGHSPEALAALSHTTEDLYNQMKDAALAMGHTDEEASALALTPLVPTLAQLNNLAKDGKIVLDEQTQALVDQATAAGLLDPTPQEQMLDIAKLQLLATAAMVTAFGHDLPAAVQAYIDSLNNIPTNLPGPPGAADGAGGGPTHAGPPGHDEDIPGHASGAILMPKMGGHKVRVAEGGQAELIAPVRAFSERLAQDLGRVVSDMGMAGGQGGGDTFAVDIDRRLIAEAQMANVRRNIGGARNQQERIARGKRP